MFFFEKKNQETFVRGGALPARFVVASNCARDVSVYDVDECTFGDTPALLGWEIIYPWLKTSGSIESPNFSS
jgi:hypothetical protein